MPEPVGRRWRRPVAVALALHAAALAALLFVSGGGDGPAGEAGDGGRGGRGPVPIALVRAPASGSGSPVPAPMPAPVASRPVRVRNVVTPAPDLATDPIPTTDGEAVAATRATDGEATAAAPTSPADGETAALDPAPTAPDAADESQVAAAPAALARAGVDTAEIEGGDGRPEGRAGSPGDPGASGTPASLGIGGPGYDDRLAQLVQDELRYPRRARRRDIEGVVRVELALAASGALLEARVVRTSGAALLDRDAVATAERAAPYPPPPQSDASSHYEIEVVYDLAD